MRLNNAKRKILLEHAKKMLMEDPETKVLEENATEYGVTKSGKWAAVYDSHCSCYGWEATVDHITYYSNLEELVKADANAKVIFEHKDTLQKLYPFLKF